MENLTQYSLLSSFTIISCLLVLKILLLAVFTIIRRATLGKFVIEEDARFQKGELVQFEDPAVWRYQRAHANAIENALPFFVVGALYIAVDASLTMGLIYFWTFLAARVLHPIFFIKHLVPHRQIAWTLGVMVLYGMTIHILVKLCSA